MKLSVNHQLATDLSAEAPPVAIVLSQGGNDGGSVAPEWIHLLPAGKIETRDTRGPFTVASMARLIEASMADGPLPLDQDHATDLAAPDGRPSPARGWIVELQERADGLWGKVEWTDEGRGLVESRAYRMISPVLLNTPKGEVRRILRASLVNRPNLRGLAALNQESNMDFLAKLRKALNMPDDADEDAILAAIGKTGASTQAAIETALKPIAQAAGLEDGASATAILAGVEALAKTKPGDDDAVTALQAELADTTKKLQSLREGLSRDRAETFVDAAIKAGTVGVKALRDRYVSMHMKDAAGTEELINGLPRVGAGNAFVSAATPSKDGAISLNAEQSTVAAMLGEDPKDYAETLKLEREQNGEMV